MRGGGGVPAPLRLSRERHWERGRSRHRRGGWLFRLPDLPAVAVIVCPYPPTPFPAGRGDSRLFHARGFAPRIPGAEPGRHWLSLRGRCPAGACPVRGGGGVPAPLRLSRERHWERGRSRHRRGGWLFRLPDLPAVAVIVCPYPPTPFPAGRGDSRLFHARGFAPRIPGAEPGRHWLSLRGRCPAGGWLFRLPDLPAVAVPFCPHPPYPLPLRGRGSFLAFLCKGLRPLHPRG